MEGWEGEKGEGMEEQDKAAKDKAWKRSQAMALGGRGFRFTVAPAEYGPQNVPFFSFQPVNHCPFKHHVVPCPLLPVLQTSQAPSSIF